MDVGGEDILHLSLKAEESADNFGDCLTALLLNFDDCLEVGSDPDDAPFFLITHLRNTSDVKTIDTTIPIINASHLNHSINAIYHPLLNFGLFPPE
jgi:hypothetical protein